MVSRGLLSLKKDSLLRFRRGEGTPCHTGIHRWILYPLSHRGLASVKNFSRL
ncbi:unnamed protein product, partial [Rangifer tarandus platyrhynchus]